jgi:hypothetical protein
MDIRVLALNATQLLEFKQALLAAAEAEAESIPRILPVTSHNQLRGLPKGERLYVLPGAKPTREMYALAAQRGYSIFRITQTKLNELGEAYESSTIAAGSSGC